MDSEEERTIYEVFRFRSPSFDRQAPCTDKSTSFHTKKTGIPLERSRVGATVFPGFIHPLAGYLVFVFIIAVNKGSFGHERKRNKKSKRFAGHPSEYSVVVTRR